MGNGNKGLKNQFGVGDPNNPGQNAPDPQDTGSDKQAQDFQAAFQQEQGAINGHLQYTAVNAEASGHDPLATRRDAMYTAFQSALAKIDRKDPSKAQGAIDKMLGDARALSGEVAAFRQEAEKAKTDWDSRQGKYDDAVRQVEELEAWEDPKAPALRGLVDGIRKQVNQRQYAQSTNTLNQLLPKLTPIYEEYLRQKEAKPQYEQQLADQSARLGPLKAADRPSQPMTAKAGEVDAALAQARAKADGRDFVAGLEQMQTLRAAVEEFDKMANDPERTKFLADIGGIDQIVQPPSGTASHSQEAAWTAITSLKDEIAPAGDGGDYAGANRMVGELKDKVEAFKAKHAELEQRKQAYDNALTQVQPRLQAASMSEPQYAKLQPMLDELTTAKGQSESAAQAEDFVQALTLVHDLSTKLEGLEQARAEIDRQKQEYETALAALKPRLEAVSVTDPQCAKLQPQEQELAKAQADMEAAAQSGDYQQGSTLLQDVSSKLDALEQAKAEIDRQKQAYEDALTKVQPRLQGAAVSEPQYAQLQPMREALTSAKGQSESAAQAEDFAQALTLVQDLSSKLDALEQAKAEIDKQKLVTDGTGGVVGEEADSSAVNDETAFTADGVGYVEGGGAGPPSSDYESGYEDGLMGYESRPGPRTPDALIDYEEGYAKGHYAFEQKSSSGEATEPSDDDGGSSDSASDADSDATPTEAGDCVGGEFTFKEKELCDGSIGYAKWVTKVGGSVKYGPPDAKPKDIKKEQVEQALLEKVWDVLTKGKLEISGGFKFNLKEKELSFAVNINWSCEWGPAKFEFAPAELSVVNVDPKNGITGPKISIFNAALSYKDETVNVGGSRIEFSAAVSFQIEITPNWVVIAETLVAKGTIEVVGAVVGVALTGGLIVVAVGTVAGTIEAIVGGYGIGNVAQAHDPSVNAALGGFKAGMSRGPAPSDRFAKLGYDYGQKNHQALFERERGKPANAGVTDDDIHEAIAAKADEALGKVSGAITFAVRTGLWDGYLAQNTGYLGYVTAKNAYFACFHQDPSNELPDTNWRKYLDQHPYASSF